MMKIRKIAHATFAATLLTFAACGDDSSSVSAESTPVPEKSSSSGTVDRSSCSIDSIKSSESSTDIESSSAAEECNSVGYIPFRYTKGCLAPDSLIACEEYTTANYAGSIEISTACSSGRLIFFIGDEQKDGLGIKKLPEGIYSRIGPFYFESEKYSYTVTLDSARVVDKSTGEVWHFKEKG
jgi:hypothetical protein